MGYREKLNLRVDSEDQNSKIVSPLNSFIEEQSAKLGSNAVVIDGQIINLIEKKVR